uniref:Mitochondria-eating protein n=1 Tax=Salmo trutta TaxID=8032 RepID=A0A673X3T9_SALTR
MADSLRKLVNTSFFSVMQDKLESWYKDYHVISCDKNLNRCCELVELTSKIQGQLFTILNLTFGGHYAGVDMLKSHLLPWLGTCFSMATPSVTNNTSLNLIQESVKKGWKIRKMDTQLCSTFLQLESLKQELADTHLQLDDTKNMSATTLLVTEDEILQLKAELRAARDQVETNKRKLNVLDDSESQGRLLRDEMSFLTAEKSMLQERSTSPLPRHSHHSSPLRTESPTRLNNSSRHARLVSRLSDPYAVERLEAQSLLRRYIDDLEMVQIIIFIATVEAFQAAKLAYHQFKLRVSKNLSPCHLGPEVLEESVVDYIVKNLDLYDVQASVNDVINAMNVNPWISFSPEVDFVLISSLIRETCRVAFAMQTLTLDSPLDLALTSDPELYSDNTYHCSYDSEFTAPLVVVIVKGEAVTRRGALWRSRSRSYSPVCSHSGSPTCTLLSYSDD